MKNPRQISTNGPDNFWSYNVPLYKVTDNGIVSGDESGFFETHAEGIGSVEPTEETINFCKGDKSDPSKERQTGVFVESLLEVCASRLRGVNTGELASRETSVAITKIEEAIMWLEKRSADRKARGVEQTYQK